MRPVAARCVGAITLVLLARVPAGADSMAEVSATLGAHSAGAGANSTASAARGARDTVTRHLPSGGGWARGSDPAPSATGAKGWAAPQSLRNASGQGTWLKASDGHPAPAARR